MSKRLFTADFHLGMDQMIKYENRPFSSVDAMNQFYLDECITRAQAGDVIFHIGDLACFNRDRQSNGLGVKPREALKGIRAEFINIRGNHDINNRVKSLCESMRIHLSSRYPNVSMSHYPTYDKRCTGHFCNGDIHLCGHVHRKFRHCLDLSTNCLNINVGVDVWNHHLVSEDELIAYLNRLFMRKPRDMYKCRTTAEGKVIFDETCSAF